MGPSASQPDKKPSYARLSPQDASFLVYETPDLHMHVGLVAIIESAAFELPSGEIDVTKFRAYIGSRLQFVPRCRQRLERIPFTKQPVWVDDRHFRIEDHVLAARVEAPGGNADLQALAGEIFSRKVDRSKPLWQMHVVQGLTRAGQFAVIAKVHHCMIDGIAGVDFMAAMLTSKPVAEIELTPRFAAAHTPSRFRLLFDEARRLSSAPRKFAALVRQLAQDPEARTSAWQRIAALVHLVASGVRGTPANPLSAPARARRAIGWTATDRAAERSVRARLGSTRDDVTLACAAGAARSFLQRKGARLSRLRIRAMCTMSLRTRAERADLGNRVGMLIVDLPVGEADARVRLQRVSDTVLGLKQSKQALGADVLAQIDQWTGTAMQSFGMWLANTRRAYNLFVTNIPGPPSALYALESKLLEIYPIAPIFGGQHVSVATLSYLGKVHWGVQYAGDEPAELGRFVADLDTAFAELAEAAAAAPPRLRVIRAGETAVAEQPALVEHDGTAG